MTTLGRFAAIRIVYVDARTRVYDREPVLWAAADHYEIRERTLRFVIPRCLVREVTLMLETHDAHEEA